MRRKVVLASTAMLGLLAAVAWVANWRAGARQERPVATAALKVTPGSSARSTVAVESAAARAASARTDIRGVGSLRSDESVQIASEIAGRVASFNFKEGEAVEAGDVLVKLDDALAQAELADASARFDLANANMDRAKQLSRTGNVTEKAIDEATAAFEIARSALELQRVRLAKHTIAAPFSGDVGIRNVSPGAYVAIGTPMVNLEKIDVLKVDFKLPELVLSSIAVGQAISVSVDAIPGRTFDGEIYAIDPQVDVNGRALRLRARIQNPDRVLRPGLFARITVQGQVSREVVMVPESAIVPRSGENFVFRIEGGRAVEAKVKLGERKGAEVEVLEGLAAGADVVTAGQLKLRDGLQVEVIEAKNTPSTKQAR
jgi:membrane fusion protein, multidrug efflux system